MLRFACFKDTFSNFSGGVSSKPPQKSSDASRPQKRLAVLGLNFSYFFIGELKTLIIVLKAMTAYVQALNTKYMPNCDIFILSANSSFFMWGFWDFYVRFLRFLCDVRFLRFAFGINPADILFQTFIYFDFLYFFHSATIEYIQHEENQVIKLITVAVSSSAGYILGLRRKKPHF